MALERSLNAVPPTPLTTDGSAHGVATVASTCGFFVKQQVTLQGPLLPPLTLEVKRVVNYTTLWLGIKGPQMTHNVDLSAYTVAAGAFIFAEEQSKATLSTEARDFASYVQEPVNAWKSQAVDCNGNPYGAGNPLPVSFDGTISIGQVEVIGTNGNIVQPNPDGSLNVIVESVPSPNNIVVSKYAEALAVASGSTIQIVTYTVPPATQGVLQKAHFSGENVARYDLLINSIKQDTARTMFGADLTGEFNFTTGNDSGYLLNPGDTVSVQVYNSRPSAADFEARIQVLQIPI
jgi:hypothetical protein